jgi:iron only hydrogenase large subunit-like protein
MVYNACFGKKIEAVLESDVKLDFCVTPEEIF